MLDMLLFLAQVAPADPHHDLPAWAKYVMGPFGALIILGVYAWRTEKHRIPEMSAMLAAEQARVKALYDENEREKDELRAALEVKIGKVENELRVCREKYTKERATRTWWQAQARAHGVQEPLPEDIDKTSFGSFSGEA